MKRPAGLVLLAAIAPAANSQSVLYTFDGDSAADRFGTTVSGAGDVNRDGFADVIVGALKDDINGANSGSARVFSGLDGSVLYTFVGDSPHDSFGNSVSGAGDVNGDGYPDMIVGALLDDNNGQNSGSARVFSGLDGSFLYTFNGDSAGDYFGKSVSGAGDVNRDGFDDLIIGAHGDDNNGSSSGSARVFSGFDGSVLYTFDGDSMDDQFGISVSGAGDFNGDGYDDLIVGAWLAESFIFIYDTGIVTVFSGKNGSVLRTFEGDNHSDRMGISVSGAGDVNADGYDDVIVGAHCDDNNGSSAGIARVYTGPSGGPIFTFEGDSVLDYFGFSVSAAGDVNGDGYADLIVGAYGVNNNGPQSGSVRVLSGMDGSTIHTFDGDSPYDVFGRSVSGAGDVNGDGYDDLIVGARLDDNNGTNSGSARIFSGCDTCGTTIGQNYCGPANLNSTGQSAVISAFGSTTAADNFLTLTASQLPLLQFGYFLASETQGFVAAPGGSQGTLCLGGQVARFRKQIQDSGTDGQFTIQVDLTSIPTTPPHTVMAGETWNFQAWSRDLNPAPTSNFTDGIEVVFN